MFVTQHHTVHGWDVGRIHIAEPMRPAYVSRLGLHDLLLMAALQGWVPVHSLGEPSAGYQADCGSWSGLVSCIKALVSPATHAALLVANSC
jgi:hypothetical protein